MYSSLEFDVTQRGVATVTLNRPERGNALNHPMRAELIDVFARIAADSDVRIAVLKGAGKNFCSGADFGGGFERNEGDPVITLPEIFDALDRLPKPTMSIVQGAAAGAGATLAVCCDIVVTADTGFFSLPEVRIGRPLGGPLPYMVRAMGETAARRYLLTGERIHGERAVRLGLAHECAVVSELDDLQNKLVEELLLGAPNAQAATKAALLSFTSIGKGELEQVSKLTGDGLDQQEAKEGVAAFREKRKPYWYR